MLFSFSPLMENTVATCTDVILQVRLEWPTDLAINPLDNSLYILDNNIVLQVKEHSFFFPSTCDIKQIFSREFHTDGQH